MGEIQKITDNIYSILIPLPNNPLRSLNAYVVKGERNLLIDTGFRQEVCRQALTEGLRELDIQMDHTDIFLTHLHSDHTGLAPELASDSTKIFIGELDCRLMPGSGCSFRWETSDRHYAEEGFPMELLRRLTTENPAQGLAPVPYDDYIPVYDGDVFDYGGYHFRAIHTPGHTQGHMMLMEDRTGIAFLGDHVLFDITPNISRWSGYDDSLGDYLNSLRKVRELPISLPLPAHRTVSMNLVERCDQLIAHHEKRCAEILKILSPDVRQNAWEIAAQMTWKIRARSWEDFPAAQKWFAVGEAMAHLDYLVSGGAVAKTFENGKAGYTRKKQG